MAMAAAIAALVCCHCVVDSVMVQRIQWVGSFPH